MFTKICFGGIILFLVVKSFLSLLLYFPVHVPPSSYSDSFDLHVFTTFVLVKMYSTHHRLKKRNAGDKLDFIT